MEMKSLHACYRAIVKAYNAPQMIGKANNLGYAASYAKYGLNMPDAIEQKELTDASRTQALYVRTNLSTWRGNEAKAVRAQIDRILKGK